MKLTFSRAAQIESAKSNGYRVVSFKKSSLVVAFKTQENGKVSVKGWSGARDKADFFFSFPNEARALVFVNYRNDEIAQREARRAAQAADKRAINAGLKASDQWSVGDVAVYSWGYEQTNVDYFEVVEVLAKSVKIREIQSARKDTGNMSGVCQPVRGAFLQNSKVELKRVNRHGFLTMSCGVASKWDGRQSSWSSYH